MYTLYYSPGAASMLPHLLLIEAQAPYELRPVDLAAGGQRDPEYLKLNPNGVVPTLLVNEAPYYEAAALAQLIAENHPEAALAPPLGTARRATYLQWMTHLANTLQPAYRLWFYPGDAGAVDPDAVKAAARQKIETIWERIDALLSDGRAYFVGDGPTALDFYALMLMRWSRNMPRPATEWPHLKAFAERMKARPSWKTLYEREGLTEWA
ncbi:glutathione S-transferase family protein [Tahibacter amnicola]|uniref:Glutathione S-transferase family protein n=1 Tax=Tahibacter amnicola TaxID=2976241 RepID=A0ABY6BEK3_9GAMM|nr:glutathione S-transferase family protein [Tahibacter amnicola]UXI67972.1 glutathione S-transferase family protein [Tahibacter amnicola]